MSEIEEASKAVAETAKFGTKSVEITEKILGFLSKVFKEPMEQTSGIIGDKLKFFRWKRQVRMVDEVTKILVERNIKDTKQIPFKFAIPMIENASLEEDDKLQDLWNKLIANAMDPNFTDEVRYSYIEIIKSLNPLDVLILKNIYDSLIQQRCDLNNITTYSLTKEQIASVENISLDECILSIYNLFRVQCITSAILKGDAKLGTEPLTIYKGVDAVTMTPLGRYFVEACIR